MRKFVLDTNIVLAYIRQSTQYLNAERRLSLTAVPYTLAKLFVNQVYIPVCLTACFGSQPYSREELLAEMDASFLCSGVQIDFDNVIENNAAYLAGWLKILREDSKFIFKAAAEAQKAADYVLNRRLVVEASSN